MEIIIALLAWAAISPDPVSLRVSRGATGAVRGVIWGVLPPRMARRLTVTGRIIKKAHRGWVHGARQAKMQRRQRKDALCKAIHGVRHTVKVAGRIGKRHAPAAAAAGLAVLAGGKAAVGWVRNRLSGGNGAAAPMTPFDVTNTPKTTDPNPAPSTDSPLTAPNLPVASSPIGGTTATEPVQSEPPAAHPENTPTEGDTMNTTGTDTELTDIHAVKARAARITDMANDLVVQIEAIRAEGTSLGEDYEATDWGTNSLDEAVNQIVEHTSNIPAPTEAIEATMAAVQAVSAAAQIGETAAEHGARGKLEAFNGEAA